MVTWNLASNDELMAIVDDDTIDYTIRIAALHHSAPLARLGQTNNE